MYLRDVVYAEGRGQLLRVAEADLVGGPLQRDLHPQEETVPQRVPAKPKLYLHDDPLMACNPECGKDWDKLLVKVRISAEFNLVKLQS